MPAYNAYVLERECAVTAALKVALGPCVDRYAEISTRLASRPDSHCKRTHIARFWNRVLSWCPYHEVRCEKAARHLEGLADLYAHAGPPERQSLM